MPMALRPGQGSSVSPRKSALPAAVTLWGWEGREDLFFLKDTPVSVAYYAGTIYVRPGLVFCKPRLRELKAPGSQQLCPVFRIENSNLPEVPSDSAMDQMTKIVKSYLNDHNCKAVQIDYDARASERDFYARWLKRLRRELAPRTHISITALASWCLDDRWLPQGSADEAVVMLFSMGPTGKEVLELLAKRQLDTGSGLPLSIGISANEPETNGRLKQISLLKSPGRLYIFSSLPWTKERFQKIADQVLERSTNEVSAQ